MKMILYLIIVGGALTLLAHTKKAVAQTPQIKCEISMSTWCIARFDGTVSMKDGGATRIWTLQAFGSPSNSSMVIIESKECSDETEEQIKFIGNKQILLNNGNIGEQATYELNSNGCRLIFQFPMDKTENIYKQAMLYGVLVGKGKRIQLYKVQ